MPTKDKAASAKRKRPAAAEPASKRRRDSNGSDTDPNAQILLLEQGILESKKKYNDITVLLTKSGNHASGNPEAMLATVALCRVFMRLYVQGAFSPKSSSEKEAVVASWLRDQLAQFKNILFELFEDEDLAGTALTLCMRLLKAEGDSMSDRAEYSFPRTFLQQIVNKLLTIDNEDVQQAFIEEYVEQHDDIRYFTFIAIKNGLNELAESEKLERVFDRTFTLLSALDGVPEKADELEDFYVQKPTKKSHSLMSVVQHKRQGQDAWLALFNIVETKDQRKRILEITSTNIAPWFNKPELLSDFLTSSYNAGGSMSLLALSGVFYLIQQRNLDYPSFYPKLYSLLSRDILHSKHRSKFFRLLDTFLASTHLPAALVASFIKRLARLTLNAPPSAVAFVIPWVYNLLKRHPTCTFMIHRQIRDEDKKEKIQSHGVEDPFLAEEEDPMKTNAIDSSLWELVQMQSHYHPNVATIAKILSEQFTKQSYNMEDFLDHSYATVSVENNTSLLCE